MNPTLTPPKKAFVETWGEMGPTWGISRTMAQVHALLMVHDGPLTTDDIMAHLRISRGNASINLRELVTWGLVRKVVRLGERKEYFEGEKEVWKIFCNIARERKRRELDPLLASLDQVRTQAEASGDTAFKRQVESLHGFVQLAGNSLDKVSRLPDARLLTIAARALDPLL